MIDYDQDLRVSIVGWADLHVVILCQFINIRALDVLQLKSDILRFVAHLLAGQTLVRVLSNGLANARPCVTFLDSRHYFGNTLMAHCIVSFKENLLPVELRHYDHAGACVQCTLTFWIFDTYYICVD